MIILDKLLNYISSKSDLSDNRKEKIKNFRKTRLRLIEIMIKTGKISKFKLIIIDSFLTLFSCGKVKNAPGTLASFITVILWLLTTELFVKTQLAPFYENIFWLSVITIFTIYAIMFIPIYTRNFIDEDHPSIVMDEVVGQLIALCISYLWVREYYHEESWLLTKIVMFSHMFLSFLLFRTFDIAKPSIVGWIDRNIKNPFGVMLDDIVAGLLSATISVIIFVFCKNSILQLHGY